MALSLIGEGLKQVPWFSLGEWHEVYKQIYSNDITEQTKGYERLLVWKSRLPKIPVGVECTLSIIQVCLRDREITPKIESAELPPYYENDLCLLYSTTIMRFLNHVANIGQTKQSSLFQIAKQLKIPQWIVNIRHDAAHGHELPSISVLRIATNILLEWLHEEYWAAETKAMEKDVSVQTQEESETEEVQTLTDLIELWIAIGLYIHAGYTRVEDVPDEQLKNTLRDLRNYANANLSSEVENGYTGITPQKNRSPKKLWNQLETSGDDDYKLTTAKTVILYELSGYLSKNKTPGNKDDVVLNVLFEADAFLPGKEFLEIFEKGNKEFSDEKGGGRDCLPSSLTIFWQEFLTLLHEKEILEKLLIRLMELVNNDREKEERKLVASLWIKYIASSMWKIKIAQQIKHRMEQARENNRKKITSATLSLRVQEEVDRQFPEFKDILWFNALGEIPSFLTDINFVKKIISNLNNKLSLNFIPPMLELVTPSLQADVKRNLLNFVKIYIGGECSQLLSEEICEVKSCEDFEELLNIQYPEEDREDKRLEIGDRTTRNTNWTIDNDNYDWGNCPFGILPWQLESMETVDTISFENSNNFCKLKSKDYDIVPGIIDVQSLTMKSKINWDSVLVKKRRTKRNKRNSETVDNVVGKAMEMVKQEKNKKNKKKLF